MMNDHADTDSPVGADRARLLDLLAAGDDDADHR